MTSVPKQDDNRLLACLDTIACHAKTSVVVIVFALLLALFRLFFFVCVLWLLIVSQSLNVHPRLIASSQPCYISFQSNSMPNSYCLRQTY